MMSILYQMHISWFETEMALETIESVLEAVKYAEVPVKVYLCLNSQTYLETPIEGQAAAMFADIQAHPQFKEWEVTYKTDEEALYNVGDWRRDCYNEQGLTVWGESDCLMPIQYFTYIESISKQLQQTPFVITLPQKKMWDESWKPVEHSALQPFTLDQVRILNNKLVTGEGFLNLRELNEFNEAFSNHVAVTLMDYYKGDGALVCLSPGFPRPFIAEGLHMCGEDTYFYNFCRIKKVPLYLLQGLLKGHNTAHPKKRMNYSKTEAQKNLFRELDSTMRNLAHTGLASL